MVLNLRRRQKFNNKGGGQISRKEIARKKLKNYQLQSILILTSGVIASILVQYLTNNDVNAILGPVSWPAAAIISATTFMAIAIYIKAYSFYLYSRLFDVISAIVMSPTRYEKEAIPTAPVQPPVSRPITEAVKSQPKQSYAQVSEVPREPSVTRGKVCPYCGRELPLGDIHVFCPFCGKKLK